MFDELCRAGRVDLEVVPQGTLAERMRAAGAGIGVFYCPVGVGTPLAEGKETREIDGLTYVLEHPIKGDVALISPHRADALGNLRRLPGADGVSGPWRRTASRSRSCRNGSTSICSRDLVVYGA